MNTHTHVIKSQVAMALSIGTGRVFKTKAAKEQGEWTCFPDSGKGLTVQGT